MLTDAPSAAPTSRPPPPHRLSTRSPIPTRSGSALSHTWAGTATRPHTAGCMAPTEQFRSPPRPSIAIMPLDSCRLGEGSDPALAPTGVCSLYHGPPAPPPHTQVTCRQPSVAPATNTSCPSQNWPEQLAICSAVCPSVHWRRQSYLGALCGQGPATLWNSQKLTFLFPPLGLLPWPPAAGAVTPCHAPASHRHVFDRNPTEARGKVSRGGWGLGQE